MNTKTIVPVHVCDIIAHATISLLSVLDEDAVTPPNGCATASHCTPPPVSWRRPHAI